MAQMKLALPSNARPWLGSISQAVVIAELLDILTTLVGSALLPQLWETNPLPVLLGGWFPTIIAKVFATLLIVIVLERVEKWPRLVWIIPTIASLPVVWNLTCILAELLV